jgi:hypothetical protein
MLGNVKTSLVMHESGRLGIIALKVKDKNNKK